ncbi:hypothetical protein EYD10_13004 [Varanus komodoensis]|uniref:Uncharacterized protein n=1 Tax=Varanus komodoensis TaxID=61221 RepID=A0A8D2LHJ7_VARKO|nr:protein PET117 homolog, mitochondrial [Varanus komodoensis]KAF7240494.1 hypothetical protein EYD10_13004 [Varanus komodoensis]
MSAASRAVLAGAVLVSGGVIAGVHLQQRRLREKLREGVARDVERQSYKQGSLDCFEEKPSFTKQMEMERSKVLRPRASQQ